MNRLSPKKSLGQNFLTSRDIVMDIIDAGDIVADDIVLEIGPGKGILTESLVKFAAKVVAIEKDKELVVLLKEKFKKELESVKLEILESDILDFDPNLMSFYDLSYKVIANIPYYITGQIIRQFLSAKFQPNKMVLMLQKEVAQRIVAKDKKESILSISVKVYGKPKIIKTVKAGSFFPKPKVDSAVLLIEDISKNNFKKNDEQEFFKILKTGFSSKRKMLSNNLKKYFGAQTGEILKHAKIKEGARAEDLALKDWLNISK